MTGKHIEVFLVDGAPGGITTAEIAGWAGHVLAGPRPDLASILRRNEVKRNGAYLLLGGDEDASALAQCYIGRTENFVNRFRDHMAKKDFWDRVVIITAKDDAFNEGHWGYLEARLVELAREATRVELLNENTPQGRKLSEAQASDMEAFIGQLQIVLPVLGVNAIRTRPVSGPSSPSGNISPVFDLVNSKTRVNAQAQVVGGEFTVLEGSTVIGEWASAGRAESTKRAYAAYRAQHERLIADGSIVIEAGVGRVTRHIPFRSPSTAGAIALGRSCNGRIEWTWSGGTYGAWEERDIDV